MFLRKTLLIAVFLCAAVTTSFASPADDQVNLAKQNIIQNQNFVEALSHLNTALGFEPANQKALFWKSVIILTTNEDISSFLQQAGVLDANKQFIGIDQVNIPATLNTSDVQAILTGTTVQFDLAFNQLASITPSFSDSITIEGETVDLDYADVKALEIIYAFLKGLAHIYNAYDMADIDVDVMNPPTTTAQEVLNSHPDLFGPHGNGQAELNLAQAAFVKLIDSYVAASAHIRSRNDNDPRNFMIRFYPAYDPLLYPNVTAWQNERDNILAQEERGRTFLNEIKNNMLGLNSFVESPLTQEERLGNERANPINFALNLNPIFHFPSDFRNFITNVLNQESEQGFMHENFFDPSLGGIAVNMDPQDFNYLQKKGVNFLSAFSTTAINWDDVDVLSQSDAFNNQKGISIVANGAANNAVQVNWNIPNMQHLEGSTLYRDTQPNVTQQSTFIAFISPNAGNPFNPSSFTFTDTTLTASGKYYYRVFNSYNWGPGKVGKTYSDVAAINFNSQSINHAPVLNFISDKQTHKTSVLEFEVSASDSDNQPLHMSVRLQNGSSILPAGSVFTDHGNGTGTFRWVLNNAAEVSTNFIFRVSDGALSDEQLVRVTVTDTNPIITPVSDKTVHVGETITFDMKAIDPDNDPLSWMARYDLHSPVSDVGASFVDHGNGTGTFSWTPKANYAGQSFFFSFTLMDPAFAGGDAVNIQVLPAVVEEGLILSGQVVDENGNGVPGITVLLQNLGTYHDRSIAEVITDQNGNYKFIHVETLTQTAARIKRCTTSNMCTPISAVLKTKPRQNFVFKDAATGKMQIEVSINPLNLVDQTGLDFVMRSK